MTGPQRPLAPRDGRRGRTVRPPAERPPSAPTAPPAAEHSPPPQQGVRPERVARGVASPEPRCAHRWEVIARQKWLWHITVRCRACGYGLPLQGRWWRERDVQRVVDQTLDRMAAEQASWAELGYVPDA